MANTYVITSVTSQGDTITVQGTVNGVAVSVQTWLSAAGGSLASAVSFQNFIYGLMLAQYNALQPVSYPTLLGTFTK